MENPYVVGGMFVLSANNGWRLQKVAGLARSRRCRRGYQRLKISKRSKVCNAHPVIQKETCSRNRADGDSRLFRAHALTNINELVKVVWRTLQWKNAKQSRQQTSPRNSRVTGGWQRFFKDFLRQAKSDLVAESEGRRRFTWSWGLWHCLSGEIQMVKHKLLPAKISRMALGTGKKT